MTANCRSKNIARVRGRLPRLVVRDACCWRRPAPRRRHRLPQPAPPAAAAAAAAPRPTDPAVPPGYVIGTDDVLSIVYWKDKDMSADAQVRPDGRIALPLINEVQAAGLTPEQLREKLTEESKKYMEDANITVVVRQINSRKAFITGEVNKPGPYPLTSATTVHAADLHGRRPARVRQRQEDHHHADRERPRDQPAVQLPRRHLRQDASSRTSS